MEPKARRAAGVERPGSRNGKLIGQPLLPVLLSSF